jgi:hypothetical protein
LIHSTNRLYSIACIFAVFVSAIPFLVASHTAARPRGSDNDEYLQAGESIRQRGFILIAGREQTKYSPGYPLLIAAVGDRPDVLKALNGGVYVAAVILFVLALLPRDRMAAFVCAICLLASHVVWKFAPYAMADVICTALVILLAADLLAKKHFHPAIAACICVTLILFRTQAVLPVIAWSLQRVWLDRKQWLLLAIPVFGIGLLAVIQRLINTSGLPHATGYMKVLLLRDPFDSSLGQMQAMELLSRVFARIPVVLADFNAMVLAPQFWPLGVIAGAAAIAAAAVRWREVRVFALVLFTMQAAVLLLWPFRDPRFWLPILPVIALGMAAVFTALWQATRFRVARAVLAGALFTYYLFGFTTTWRVVERVEQAWRRSDEELKIFQQWAADGKGPLISPDYRELATVLHAPVIAVPYTRDAATLRDIAVRAQARWLVVTDLFSEARRVECAGILAEACGATLEPISPHVRVADIGSCGSR